LDDQQLQTFQNVQLLVQLTTSMLTDACWDKCVKDGNPSGHTDCMKNCASRYPEAVEHISQIALRELQKSQEKR